MIRHLFKLAWNRRRANALVLVELTACFLVLCSVFTMAARSLVHWREPLGFEFRDVWRLDLSRPGRMPGMEEEAEDRWKAYERVMIALRELDEVEAVTPLSVNVPFETSMMAYSTFVDGTRAAVRVNGVTPSALNVLRFELIAGRWIEDGDEGLAWNPVVISRNYARLLFGAGNPLGRTLVSYEEDGSVEERGEEEKEKRVVGVIADYRMQGELYGPEYVEFSHVRADPNETWVPMEYVLRLHPGTPAAFEEKLLRTVHGILPDHTASASPLARDRASRIRDFVIPLAIYGTLAVFLIVMAGLGLVGVLWQSVVRRTEEWGVRRAFGATSNAVRAQVLGELVALTTIAVVIGSALFVQLPILQVFHGVATAAYLYALGAAIVVVVSFVLVCGLYPGYLTTRVHPAEALQYE